MKSDGTRSTYARPGGLEVLAQLGAAAVDLVAAVEVRPDPVGRGVGAEVDGQLPLVRKARPAGSPITRDLTGSAICSRGTHWRAPISACPAASRT
jgi:hypothetical protein